MGAMLANARGQENGTLFSRISKPSHLATAKIRGSVSGPSPHYGWCGGLARRLKREKCALPGFVSPSWVRKEGRRGCGASGSAGALLTGRGGKDAPGGQQLHRAARCTPRLFPAPTAPPQSPGRSRRLQVPRDLSERATAEEDPVPPLGEVRVASPTRPSRLRSDRFSNLAALGCPLRLFLRSPGALVHLSGSSCAPSRGSSSPSFLSPRSTARRHPRLPVSASL